MNVLVPQVKLQYEGFDSDIRGGEVDASAEGGYNVVGLESSDVAEEGLDTWDNSTSYTTGQQVAWQFKIWTAKTDHSGTEPSTETADGVINWTFDSWMNRYSMFNGILSDATTNASSIDISFSANGVDSLAIFGLQATKLTVTITDPTAGEVYRMETAVSPELSDANWYSYLWEYQTAQFTNVVKKDWVLTDLIGSQYPLATVRVLADFGNGNLSYGDGNVSIDYLCYGPAINIGEADFGTSHGFKDFSIIEENDFGEVVTVSRKRNKKATYQITASTDQLGDIQDFLSANTTNPMVFIGNGNYSGTLVYAIASDFNPTLRDPNTTAYSIKVKGL